MRNRVSHFLGRAAVLACFSMKIFYAGCVRADTSISDFDTLKKALEQYGTKTVLLSADIGLAGEIQVKGNKTIAGKGYTLYRKTDNDENLFVVQDAVLTIQNVCISGRKEKQEEYTTAFWIRQKGTVIMDGGKIVEHYNAAGGPAVRIEPDGSFEIRDGTIQNNKAIAAGKSKGRDARGGAIANEGSCVLAGGILSGNEAIGFRSGRVDFGGIGGMLYNRGECVVKNAVIKGNYATSAGADIYQEEGALYREETAAGNSYPVQQGGEQEGADEREEKQQGNPTSSGQIKRGTKAKKAKKPKKPKKSEKTVSTKKAEKNAVRRRLDGGERYLFQWEIKHYTEQDWRQELISGCEGLRGKEIRWKWNGLLKNVKGRYVVRAAAGGRLEYVIPVTVVAESCQNEEKALYIRYCEPEEREGEKQTWRFGKQDIEKVKEEMRRQEHPLSREENQRFLREFGQCRRE